MFMTREEALTEIRQLVSALEILLEFADEEEIEVCSGDLEYLHNVLYESVLQLENSSDSMLNVEMRNYTALTIRKARQAMREAEVHF